MRMGGARGCGECGDGVFRGSASRSSQLDERRSRRAVHCEQLSSRSLEFSMYFERMSHNVDNELNKRETGSAVVDIAASPQLGMCRLFIRITSHPLSRIRPEQACSRFCCGIWILQTSDVDTRRTQVHLRVPGVTLSSPSRKFRSTCSGSRRSASPQPWKSPPLSFSRAPPTI